MTWTALMARAAREDSAAEEKHTSPGAGASISDRRWLALVFIALAQLMLALDATIVNIALPSAQAGLRFSDADRQWVITAYTLAFGGLLLLGGRVSDSRLGRKRALLLGLGGFALASALGGAAQSMGVLIAARALQGAFAALLAPTALSLLTVTFAEPSERARAFGVYGAIAGGGGAVGLVLGGLLTQYLDWRWCLYVNLPIAAIAAIGAWCVLPRDGSLARSGRLDLLGALLATVGLVALAFGCGRVADLGLVSPMVLASLGTGLLALLAFVVHEARARTPLLPLRIVLDRYRGVAYLSTVLALAGMFGAFLFLTYELQVVMGFTPLLAGLAFLPLSAATLVGSAGIASRLLPRVAPRVLMVPGFVSAAIGMLALSQLRADSVYLLSIVPAEVLLGLGIACVMTPAASVATSGVGPRDAGIASAVLNTAQQVGASLGTAVLNTVAASVTLTALGAAAPRADALVHGYAAAAMLGAALLGVGAVVSLTANSAPRPGSRGERPPSGAARATQSSGDMNTYEALPTSLLRGTNPSP